MLKYKLNKNADFNGNYEIHSELCEYYATLQKYIDLGYRYSAAGALNAAKGYTPKADGCFYCCPEVHKG